MREVNKYLMRSLMFVPGHNERLLEKASRSNADVLLLDIEDSVQPMKNKQIARSTIKDWIINNRLEILLEDGKSISQSTILVG